MVVRKRPLNSKEREKGEDDIVPVDNRSSSLMVDEPKVKVDLTKYTERHCFVFDCVLDESVDNDTVRLAQWCNGSEGRRISWDFFCFRH